MQEKAEVMTMEDPPVKVLGEYWIWRPKLAATMGVLVGFSDLVLVGFSGDGSLVGCLCGKK